MLTGDEVPTQGDAYLGGLSITKDKLAVRRLMGYCPQHDAVHDLMTGEETLEFYGRLRGVPPHKLPAMVAYLAKRLTLDQDSQHKRPAGTYSGGNRRKLSVGIALIGNPPVVFLVRTTHTHARLAATTTTSITSTTVATIGMTTITAGITITIFDTTTTTITTTNHYHDHRHYQHHHQHHHDHYHNHLHTCTCAQDKPPTGMDKYNTTM